MFALKQTLINCGHKYLTLIAGGSPTFAFLTGQDNVECSPGTFVFWAQGYLQFIPEQKFRPAALVSRIISMPGDNLICLDVGYKSFV